MLWFQLKIEHCPTAEIEALSEELMESGALSVMLTDKNDNPVLEPEPGTTPLWPEVILQALFSNALEAEEIKQHLANSRPALVCSMESLPEKDWERAWMDDFQAQRFGQNLWVCPSWLSPPEPDAVNLMLDPGLAFGTGTHPTTALCLTWLDQAPVQEKTIIDYGCGSGILSLAALKLGAKMVYAVDIDEQALQATHNNAQSNQISPEKLAISLPEALQEPSELLIANILLTPLIALKYQFYQLLKQDGLLVVSGLLDEQCASLIETYAPSFSLVAENHLDGWALLVFAKK